MERRKINSMLKMVLEVGPVVLFFVAYVVLKDRVFTVGGTEYSGFIVATAAFLPLLVITTLILWRLTGHLSKMQIATVVLAVVFGGLSVWLNDERFFKIKPTLIYLLFGIILGVGLLRGQSYLRLVLEEAIPLQHEGWMILTKRLCAFFFALAVANEVVWRMFSTEVWVSFKTFGLTAALFLFFMGQGKLLQTYGVEKR
ncbi:inner membrane-spanning protein YciB [Falsirhodobacter sp. 20TX0035]|uniref:inner membrane-spanning protein YciB n=1 Tax=Falsirhodobacter sp. 20TX0035 TaxID=3022019 RepID=UPI00232AA563|nr:inner membrane-spanning protein YciB [Falsirhodobacter sp. 20TX0035]MDB6455140.1 septation protein IspZ [Falsirhodobacter sp. 20TX0035]